MDIIDIKNRYEVYIVIKWNDWWLYLNINEWSGQMRSYRSIDIIRVSNDEDCIERM